ncbi:hypothetical protein D3C80_1392470 [compost metagenome]
MAVQAGHHRRRLARQVDQDRRGRTAVLGAVVDPREHDQRRRGRQPISDGQQHGDGRHRTQAGQHADQSAQGDADQAVQQVVEGKGGLQSQAEVVEQFHVYLTSGREYRQVQAQPAGEYHGAEQPQQRAQQRQFR